MTRDEICEQDGIAKAEVTHLERQVLGLTGERCVIIWFQDFLPQIMNLATAREIVSAANLAAREQNIQDPAGNLDVSEAGNVKFNPREITQRRALFNQLRRDVCSFLGFALGASIPDPSRVGML